MTDTLSAALGGLAAVALLAFVIWAYVSNHRHRRTLTPEERAAHDAESSRIRGDW